MCCFWGTRQGQPGKCLGMVTLGVSRRRNALKGQGEHSRRSRSLAHLSGAWWCLWEGEELKLLVWGEGCAGAKQEGRIRAGGGD